MSCSTCPISLICLGEGLRRAWCKTCEAVIVSDAQSPLMWRAYILPPGVCPEQLYHSMLMCPDCIRKAPPGIPRRTFWRSDFKTIRHRGFREMVRRQRPTP